MTIELQPPQLVINQKFAHRPAGTQFNTRPFLIGSLAHLVRYSEASEQGSGFLAVYDRGPEPIEGTSQWIYSWPGNPVGNVVDLAFTKVQIQRGLFRYYADASTDSAVQSQRNLVRMPNSTVASDQYGISDLLDTGVRVGDVVRLTGQYLNLDPYEQYSYVIGFKGEPVAAQVGIPESASTNYSQVGAFVPTVSHTSAGTFTLGTTGTYSDPTYTHVTETYILTVTTGGLLNAAKASVSSASGTDNVAEVTLSASTVLGTRGLTLTIVGVSSFAVGDKITVVARQTVAARTLSINPGTYTGKQDRNYIVEVTTGGSRTGVSPPARVRVTLSLIHI